MACHVLRLSAESECGACSRDVPPCRVVITDELETPVFVVVCRGCTGGLEGAEASATIRDLDPGG